MPNVNTSQSLKNIPTQFVSTSATQTALLVPAQTVLPSYPSPIFPVGSGLFIYTDPDFQSNNPTSASPTFSNSSLDGQPFKLRLVLEVVTGAGTTIIPSIYQVPNTTVVNNASSTLGSSTLTNDALIVTGATLTAGGAGKFQYILESQLMWDSVSGKLNGIFSSVTDTTYTVFAANTSQLTSVTARDLNFLPTIAFGTGNAGNGWSVREFSFERL